MTCNIAAREREVEGESDESATAPLGQLERDKDEARRTTNEAFCRERSISTDIFEREEDKKARYLEIRNEATIREILLYVQYRNIVTRVSSNRKTTQIDSSLSLSLLVCDR